MNNMLTNTAQTPRHTIPAGNGNAGAVGCLGMSAGGSGGAEAAAPGKGGGKGAKAGGKAGGKGATDCPKVEAHAHAFLIVMRAGMLENCLHRTLHMDAAMCMQDAGQGAAGLDAFQSGESYWGCEAYGGSTRSRETPGDVELLNCMQAQSTCWSSQCIRWAWLLI